jgi:DNA polymerase III epsilon subunit-like protein
VAEYDVERSHAGDEPQGAQQLITPQDEEQRMQNQPTTSAAHVCRACGADESACALDPGFADERRWLCHSCEQGASSAGEGCCLGCLARHMLADFGHSGPEHAVCARCADRNRQSGARWCYSCAQSLPSDRFDAGKGRCQECLATIAARREKHCIACGRLLALESFAQTAASADGRRHTCLSCQGGAPAPASRSAPRPRSAARDWVAWAQSILADPDWICLDTETTGFSRDDVVIEIAMLDGSGRTLLDTLVASPIPVPLAVQRLTGITPASLSGAPTLAQLLPALTPLLSRGILAYNAPFDVRLLTSSLRRVGVTWAPSRVACALQAFTGYRASVGVPRLGSGATLGDACAQLGIRRSGGHRALDDARATLALLRAMAGSGWTQRRMAPSDSRASSSGRPSAVRRSSCSSRVRCSRGFRRLSVGEERVEFGDEFLVELGEQSLGAAQVRIGANALVELQRPRQRWRDQLRLVERRAEQRGHRAIRDARTLLSVRLRGAGVMDRVARCVVGR